MEPAEWASWQSGRGATVALTVDERPSGPPTTPPQLLLRLQVQTELPR